MLRDNWFKGCLFTVQNCVKILTLTTKQLLFLLNRVELTNNYTHFNYCLSPINNDVFTFVNGWFLHTIHNLNYKNYF